MNADIGVGLHGIEDFYLAIRLLEGLVEFVELLFDAVAVVDIKRRAVLFRVADELFMSKSPGFGRIIRGEGTDA